MCELWEDFALWISEQMMIYEWSHGGCVIDCVIDTDM